MRLDRCRNHSDSASAPVTKLPLLRTSLWLHLLSCSAAVPSSEPKLLFAAMGKVEKKDGMSDADLVEVAFFDDPAKAGTIQGLLENGGIPSLLLPTGLDGPLLGIGLLPPGRQRVMVHAGHADNARRLLSETLVEDEREAASEIANAVYLDDAKGRRPRNYGLIGAYARIWLWSLGAVGVAFGVFLLIRVG